MLLGFQFLRLVAAAALSFDLRNAMPIPPPFASFWAAFVEDSVGVDEKRFCEAFYFGDNEGLANELAALVLQGKKRATTGALWAYDAEGQGRPSRAI